MPNSQFPGGATTKVRGSLKSAGFIFWRPSMSAQNFTAIRPLVPIEAHWLSGYHCRLIAKILHLNLADTSLHVLPVLVWVSSGGSSFPNIKTCILGQLSSQWPWRRQLFRAGFGPQAVHLGCPLLHREGLKYRQISLHCSEYYCTWPLKNPCLLRYSYHSLHQTDWQALPSLQSCYYG